MEQDPIHLIQILVVQFLALVGTIDILLGIISKWTPWKWDDNLYTLLHNLIARLGKK